MSMTMLTVLQTVKVFLAYTFITIALPTLALGPLVRQRRFAERLLFYFITGNFYVINLVLLLETLHISCFFTLLVGTVVPTFLAWKRLRRVDVIGWFRVTGTWYRRLLLGYMGWKNARLRLRQGLGRTVKKYALLLVEEIRRHFLEWLLLFALVGVTVYVFGTQIVTYYGYTASDISVHNYWINALDDNDLFVAGVYPFGFHCMVYYLHKLFFTDTYVILRVFGLVQTIYIFLMLAAFLRLITKTRYIGLASVTGMLLFGAFRTATYERYVSALPQEFGMLFILPGIYFLMQFFAERRAELSEEKKPRTSRYCLVVFGMSFSLTLAAHFYDTMIAGVFCIGVAIGFLFLLFKKKYFWNIMAAGLLSIVVAVLPMGIAVATGTELQGSLNWGMKVINGTLDEEEDAAEDTEDLENTEAADGTESSENTDGLEASEDVLLTDGEEALSSDGDTAEGDTGLVAAETATERNAVPSDTDSGEGDAGESLLIRAKNLVVRIADRAGTLLVQVYTCLKTEMRASILEEDYAWLADWIIGCVGVQMLLGFLMLLMGHRQYGSVIVSMAASLVGLMLLFVMPSLGLPELMQPARSVIYLTYALPIAAALSGDCVCFLISRILHLPISRQVLSFALSGTMFFGIVQYADLREPASKDPLEPNGSIICLTNILEDEEDNTWTIISANDERLMIADRGYHYELSTFLYSMEYATEYTFVRIPTSKVYIFIEKVPIDYYETYEGSGQSVSEEGASHALPYGSGLTVYYTENRWIMMSRIYYWAETVEQIYPNDMKIYYEDEQFICYCLTQDLYSLFNLAVDYGYNTTNWYESTDEQDTEDTAESSTEDTAESSTEDITESITEDAAESSTASMTESEM